jgi:hypothetical protein
MKDLPHHIKKLNRSILRSMRKLEVEDLLPDLPTWPDSERQKKKKAKIRMRNETNNRPVVKKSEEERNQIQKKGRVPVFDRQNAEPKHARSSKKKTPKI